MFLPTARMGHKARAWVVLMALVFSPPPLLADDIAAGTMGAISDLLSSASAEHPPAGADPEVYRKALEVLKKEGLAGAARPAQSADATLVAAYGRALLLGPKANQLVDKLGQLHDAVRGGDDPAIGAAIRSLYESAGRSTPADAALAGLIKEARKVGGEAPAATARHEIERPGYRINITDAVAAGSTAVEVIIENGPGGKPARVLFEGQSRTVATANGAGLERRVEPAPACVMNAAAAADRVRPPRRKRRRSRCWATSSSRVRPIIVILPSIRARSAGRSAINHPAPSTSIDTSRREHPRDPWPRAAGQSASLLRPL